MDDSPTIRAFEDSTLDRAGLVDVVTGAFSRDRWVTDPQMDPSMLGPMFADGALSAAERSVDQPATHFCLLALDGEEVVGAALGHIEGRLLEFSGNAVGVIWSLAVKPSHRRRGLGRALFDAAREWMEARDCVQLSVSTDAGNEANELYAAAGCQRHHELVTWRLELGGEESDDATGDDPPSDAQASDAQASDAPADDAPADDARAPDTD